MLQKRNHKLVLKSCGHAICYDVIENNIKNKTVFSFIDCISMEYLTNPKPSPFKLFKEQIEQRQTHKN